MIGTVLLVLAAPDPSPSPSDVTIDGTPLGSPGFLGFVFTFGLALAVVFLFLSLTKQLRIVDRRAKALGLTTTDATARPVRTPDLGLVDAGPGGPDLEVDADVAVAPRDVLPEEQRAGSRPDGPGTGGATTDDGRADAGRPRRVPMTAAPAPPQRPSVRVTVAQLQVSDDHAANREVVEDAFQKASRASADLLVLPEYASGFDPRGVGAEHAEPLDGPFVTMLRARAKATGVAVLAGRRFPRTVTTHAR